MNLAHPANAISPTIDTALLVALASSREARSGRQLAQAIERSQTGVQHVLERLVAEGLVERKGAGRAFLYTFNHDHLLAAAVREMADARLELVRRLRELIGGWKIAPLHASLFGSAARGDGDARSDIDLLLVRPGRVDEDDEDWRGLVGHLTESIERWTGNEARLVELPEDRLGGLRRRRPPVLRELDREAIDIAGTPVRKLLPGR
jgi:predicted nucleotidyltransferase/predicted transcriptional regulator